MHIFEMQFAWFFPNQESLDYEKLAIAIREKTRRPFVSPATFIPLPPMAPADIPRLQLQTIDNSSRVNISPSRADLFVSTTNSELDKNQIDDFFKDIDTISEILLSHSNIIRLGIVSRTFNYSQNPANELSNSLLKNKYENLQEASIKIVERKVSKKFTFNDSYFFEQGIKTDTQQDIIVITRDINTAPEKPLVINMELIHDFSSLSKDLLDEKNILKVMEA